MISRLSVPESLILFDSWAKLQVLIQDVNRRIDVFYAGELKPFIELNLKDQDGVFLRTEILHPLIAARLALDYRVDNSYAQDGFVKIEKKEEK